MNAVSEQAAPAPDMGQFVGDSNPHGITAAMERAALALAGRGWKCFPCHWNKTPRLKGWPTKATTDPAQISAWWGRWPDASIGAVCGPGGNGCFVLDVDLPAGPGSLEALEAEHGSLPATLTQTTGSGGRQLFFAWPEAEGLEIKNSAGKLGPGLDVRAEGGYCILPPSGHPSGGRYAWTSPKGTRPAEAPPWLLAMVASPKPESKAPRSKPKPKRAQASGSSSTGYGRAALEAEAGRVALAPEGKRNHTLNESAFRLGQLVAGGQLDREEAEAALVQAAIRAGLSESEARGTAASGLDAGERDPRRPEGNAKPKRETPQGIRPGDPFIPWGMFRGCYIPNAIVKYPGLSPSAKLCWALLCKHAGQDGVCNPSLGTIGEELGITPRHAQRIVGELVSKGFLHRDAPSRREMVRRKTTEYTFLWHQAYLGESSR